MAHIPVPQPTSSTFCIGRKIGVSSVASHIGALDAKINCTESGAAYMRILPDRSFEKLAP
jgi:hypothetical protein